MSIPHPLQNSLMAGLKAVRLETFDEDGKVLTRASGFLVEESDGSFLYTCWHVMTGVDFLQPNPMAPPKRRRFITLYCQDVQERQPGVQAIGGGRSVKVALYDELGQPRWLQEPNDREQPDLQNIGIRVPKFCDVARIPAHLDPCVGSVVSFQKSDIFSNHAQAGTDVVIVGYPYGYSAKDITSPEPVFLNRSIASNKTSNVGYTLLDGGAAPGMSGAPVLMNHQGRWWLLGMYTGVIFPDHQYGPQGLDNDRHAALGLMAPMYFSRAFMQVPEIFDQ
jgi:Trypsin-like peptidase domain